MNVAIIDGLGMMWLTLGILPVLLVVALRVAKARPLFLSCGVAFLVLQWIGYQLTPWLAVVAGGWSGFMLQPAYVNQGLAFSTCAMTMFALGYALQLRGAPPIERGNQIRALFDRLKVTDRLVLPVALLVLVVVILASGGLQEFWRASRGRGEGQFEVLTWLDQIYRASAVMAAFLSLGLAALSSLRLSAAPTSVVAWTGLLISGLLGMHDFSRSAGLPLIMLAVVLMVTRRRLALVPPALLLGLILCSVGMNMREGVNPGIANFAETALRWDPSVGSDNPEAAAAADEALDPAANPLNALDPWTARAMTRGADAPGLVSGLLSVVAVLQPLPSALSPWQLAVGNSLSEELGTVGSVGLTTPAMGELYYALGFVGTILLVPFGMLYAVVDETVCRRRRLIDFVAMILFVGGSGVGLHSGLRPMTRPILYAGMLLLVARWWQNRPSAAATFRRPAASAPPSPAAPTSTTSPEATAPRSRFPRPGRLQLPRRDRHAATLLSGSDRNRVA